MRIIPAAGRRDILQRDARAVGSFPFLHLTLETQRFEQDELVGLATIHPSQPPQKRPILVPRCWRRSCEHRRAVLRLIARIWKDADLMPHRLERYTASDDRQFEEKATAIIGLYLNPAQNAAVFCVDEQSAIQTLDRLAGACRYRVASGEPRL